jgi:GTPase
MFRDVRVKSVRVMDTPTASAGAGEMATFALHNVARSSVRKGMVLAAPRLDPRPTVEFEADIMLLYHSTTVREGYTPVVHIRGVRAAARIHSMSRRALRTGQEAHVSFSFVHRPEFVRIGDPLVFREGRTKGIGRITSVIIEDDVN